VCRFVLAARCARGLGLSLASREARGTARRVAQPSFMSRVPTGAAWRPPARRSATFRCAGRASENVDQPRLSASSWRQVLVPASGAPPPPGSPVCETGPAGADPLPTSRSNRFASPRGERTVLGLYRMGWKSIHIGKNLRAAAEERHRHTPKELRLRKYKIQS